MKSRLFPIVIGICFVFLVGVALLFSSDPQTELPVQTELVGESIKPTEMSQTEDVPSTPKSDATPQAFMSNIDTDKLNEALRSKDLERFKEALGPDFLTRVKAGTQFFEEKFSGLEEGEIPNFNIQEFMDVFMGENAPKIDWSETFRKGFRRHFPEGEPEDYEPQMASRLREIAFATQGDLPEIMQAATMSLMKEQDFQSWALAHFKGEIGQQMKWMTQEIRVARELADLQYTIPEAMSTFVETPTEVETQDSAIPTPTPQATASTTDSIEPLPTHPNENMSAVAEVPSIDLPVQISEARITSIKEILSQHGTDEGLLRLLKTDTEGANWLLERFNSSAEIETWLSEKSTEARPSKQNLRQFRTQPLPSEVQP